MEWKSYHIFIHDMTYHDRFIKQTLKSFVEDQHNAIEQYFFIRYWQGGPHIRFRFRSRVQEKMRELLGTYVDAFLESYEPSFVLTKDSYYEQHSFDGVKPPKEELYWVEDRVIKEIPYVPEYERYGGEEAIPYSEQLFQVSSSLAMNVLKLVADGNLVSKFVFAADFFQILSSFLTNEQQSGLKKFYHEFWVSFRKDSVDNDSLVKKIGQLYKTRITRKSPFAEELYLNVIEQFKLKMKEIEKVNPDINFPYLLSSHIHMFNNRIGFPPEFEHLLPLILLEIER
ncbi:hypothetical protein H1Z61_05930 [Bacillus aquiflavi]|uniref:Thiopeptide-type bacteriocin biosynthesis domain-containing protein n=1 Tax=Bacillus aquiflavi TaxID=2672567 RepID=A0A6B3VVP5_9BACI|nr:lantibiotic dehydratase C-terminal domain-containing protein [Bacillus aquiflavi]MBA4536694.1 hypothetical protein [Bacillus aquiflavi]NEY81062.1 hypothetical protein [Bacillus aquiflavi]